MASFPPIPTTPLAVEVRPNHWRKLGPKDFSRGLEPRPHYMLARERKAWSAIDVRGETDLILVRDQLGYTWELLRLTDNVVLFRVWCRS